MSTSGSDVGPTSPLPTWQPAAAGTGTRVVQDRISLFESAGSNKARNSATSAELIGTEEYKKESCVSNRDDKDFRSSRPHHHLRTFSVGDFNQEQGGGGVLGFEERMMLQGSRAEMNQELNRRLRMKADELETIFAEHKQRIATKAVIEETESSGTDVRGRMYERYMEKRDARRREEQGRNRDEKEAKTRAMWESVERSRAELEEWHKRQENDPTEKEDEQTPSSVLVEDEEDDLQSSDGSLKSVNSKMHTYSRTMSSSSTSRISGGAAVPRPSSKAPASRSSRSSVPNSDFRKENTKPSTGISKANTHTLPINVPRSKSTSAGTSFFKEEKPPRSASLRKISVAPLTPPRTTKEPSVSKPFLKKGNSIGPSAGSGLSKLRTSMSSGINEASLDVVDVSFDSPTGSTSSLYSQDGTRVRKKWGAAQIPFLAPDGSLKRFLHFGKKSTVGDRASVSGADYDTEIGRDLVSEQIRSSRLGSPLQSYDGFSFSEGMSLHEQQVQTARRSIPTPTNFNLRKDHLSESSPKSPRAFFSLSAFRNKGVESKLR